MLLHYLPPFHSDFMYMRSETQKPRLLIQVEKELNARNWVHPKLVEEPGEVKEGRWGKPQAFTFAVCSQVHADAEDFRKLLLMITSAS